MWPALDEVSLVFMASALLSLEKTRFQSEAVVDGLQSLPAGEEVNTMVL